MRLYRLLWLVLLLACMAPATAQSPTPLPPFPTATPAGRPVVDSNCYIEPKWTYVINVRRQPSYNFGIVRQIAHNVKNNIVRAFGRTPNGHWYHVVLNPPYQEQSGWIDARDFVTVFGDCEALPDTSATPELAPEDIPPPLPRAPLPAFAQHLRLSRDDQVFRVREGILYIRRTISAEEKKDRQQAHMLLMHYQDPRLDIGGKIGAIPSVGGATVSQMASEAGAFAGITGDFYAGNYFPQGMTVIEGQVITAPKFRASFGFSHNRQPFIGYFTGGWSWPASVTAANGAVIPLQLMNVPCENGWLCLYSHHMGGRLPASYRGLRVLLSPEYEVLAIIDGEGLDIPEGHFVLRGEGTPADWLRQNVQIGDSLQLNLLTDPPWQDYETVISGGPTLLRGGEFWEDCYPEQGPHPCEEFDFKFRDSHYGLKSLPRTAIGYNADLGILAAIVVEGYEVDDSGGATRQELADMFRALGITEAMEYDGGGSASMYLNGFTVTDFGYEGERRVTNSLLFFWED